MKNISFESNAQPQNTNENWEKDQKEKQDEWDITLRNLDFICDALEKPVDEEIKEVIVALNVNAIPTNGSCGGHIKEKEMRFPYVMGSPADEPEYRFVGEEELVKELIKKHNLESKKDIFSDNKIENEYYQRVEGDLGCEETEEYKNWDKKVDALNEKVSSLIDEFYKNRAGAHNRILRLMPIFGNYYIESKPSRFSRDDIIEVSEKTKEELCIARKEFNDFKEFLKQKFFQDSHKEEC